MTVNDPHGRLAVGYHWFGTPKVVDAVAYSLAVLFAAEGAAGTPVVSGTVESIEDLGSGLKRIVVARGTQQWHETVDVGGGEFIQVNRTAATGGNFCPSSEAARLLYHNNPSAWVGGVDDIRCLPGDCVTVGSGPARYLVTAVEAHGEEPAETDYRVTPSATQSEQTTSKLVDLAGYLEGLGIELGGHEELMVDDVWGSVFTQAGVGYWNGAHANFSAADGASALVSIARVAWTSADARVAASHVDAEAGYLPVDAVFDETAAQCWFDGASVLRLSEETAHVGSGSGLPVGLWCLFWRRTGELGRSESYVFPSPVYGDTRLPLALEGAGDGDASGSYAMALERGPQGAFDWSWDVFAVTGTPSITVRGPATEHARLLVECAATVVSAKFKATAGTPDIEDEMTGLTLPYQVRVARSADGTEYDVFARDSSGDSWTQIGGTITLDRGDAVFVGAAAAAPHPHSPNCTGPNRAMASTE